MGNKSMEKAQKINISKVYDDYGAALYGVIHRIIQDENIASEVLQDTFVKVWKYQDKYDATKSSLFTWMMHIARNTAINMTRSKYIRNKRNTDQIANIVDIQSIKSTRVSVETIDISENVRKLDCKYQEVIELIYFEGFTQSEVSKNLKIPLGTVKSRVRIALRELSKVYVDISQATAPIIILITQLYTFS